VGSTGDPGGRRAIIPVESSSARREQQQQQQAEQMNGKALSTQARQLPAEHNIPPHFDSVAAPAAAADKADNAPDNVKLVNT